MFLLDTHTFLWYIFDDPRLPQNVKDIISDADDVYVSMATLWEIAIKQSIKKLEFDTSISFLVETCEMKDFKILNFSIPQMDIMKSLPFHHNDPFDRILIAQAIYNGLTIMTKDEKIAMYEAPILSFK